MGKFSEKFYGNTRQKEEKGSIELMQKMSEDFKVRERELAIKRFRIGDKRTELEKKGFDLASIDVEKPPEEVVEHSESDSMYDMLNLIDKKLKDQDAYLDRLEKAYDEALDRYDL